LTCDHGTTRVNKGSGCDNNNKVLDLLLVIQEMLDVYVTLVKI